MSKAPKKAPKKTPRLGRGLSALMADINPAVEEKKPTEKPAKKMAKKTANKAITDKAGAGGITTIAINRIERNPDQPRRYFDKAALAELTESIKDKGVLQPILLRPLPKSLAAKGKTVKDRYQIVAGERRWQASMAAGLDQMPALIRDLSDREVLEIGVVENVQREDLNPIEEALAYDALKEQFGRRQKDIAIAVGKSRAYVANRVRLLHLPERARELLVAGRITPGHANAILMYEDPMVLAELIVSNNMSVREAERYAQSFSKKKKQPAERDPNTQYLEQQMADQLGLKVSLNHKSPGGSVTIRYKTPEQLEDIMARIRGG